MSAAVFDLAPNDTPSDGISRVRFGPKQFLLASSWDKIVRLYDCSTNTLVHKHAHSAPVLDCAFGAGLTSVSGGLDKLVKWFDFSAFGDEGRVIGQHNEAVRCVEYTQALGLAVSGSWDATVRTWDPRVRQAKEQGRASVPGKVFAMSLGGDWRVTVGTAGSHISIFDLRKFGDPMEKKESPLKHQTRALATFPDNKAWAVASIDGRAAVECFADSMGSKKNFAFKCHRRKEGAVDVVYPVNCLAFHPVHSTLVTGGCDGMVVVWDPVNQKRLCVYHRYETSIASVDFSHDGSLLAVAVSYTFEEGEKEHPKDSIKIRTVKEGEVKPKTTDKAAGAREPGRLRLTSSQCRAREYAGVPTALNVAEVTFTGRYPDAGWACNNGCDEGRALLLPVMYVVSGRAVMTVDDVALEAAPGDVLVVPRGRRYKCECEGAFKVVAHTNPPWYPEQHVKMPE